MKKKRNTFIILLTVLIVAIVIWRICANRNYQPETVYDMYMNDFTEDGEQELLLFTHNSEDWFGEMRLIKPEENEVLWKSKRKPAEIHEADRTGIAKNTLAVSYYNSKTYVHKVGVEGFNKRTGEKIWEFNLPKIYKNRHYYWLQTYNDKFLHFASDSNSRNTLITCIDPDTGRSIWQTSIEGSYLDDHIYLNNRLIIKADRRIYIVNTESGKHHFVSSENSYGSPFKINESEFIFLRCDSLFKYNINDTVTELVKTVPILNKTHKNIEEIAFYKDKIVCITDSSDMQLLSFSIHNDDHQSYSFNEDRTIQYHFYCFITNINADISGFHNIKTRYIPLLIQKEADDLYDKKQVVIFDMDAFKPVWISKEFITRGSSVLTRDILFHNNYYTIIFNMEIPEKEIKPAIVTINGSTGKFHSAVHFFPDKSLVDNWFGGSMFSENCFFNTQQTDMNWCLSYPNLDLVFSTNKKLETVDAKQRLEKLLGPMNWD